MAALRLQNRGSSPTGSNIRRVLNHTAKGLGVEPLLLGQLRHSFTTWGRSFGELVRPKGRGVSVEEVAAVLGHTNTRTTRLHYDGTEVPPMVKVPVNLIRPEDPAGADGRGADAGGGMIHGSSYRPAELPHVIAEGSQNEPG